MEDMSQIDSDFEPQSRPRSCTWPLNRPNVAGCKKKEEISMKMEPTIEESEDIVNAQVESLINNQTPFGSMSSTSYLSCIKQERHNVDESFSNFSPEFNAVTSPGNLITDFSSIMLSPQQTNVPAAESIDNRNSNFTSLLSTTTPFPTYDTIDESLSVDVKPDLVGSPQTTNDELQGLPVQSLSSNSNTDSSIITTIGVNQVVSKPKSSSRKNAWGNMSYADLITSAIESSLEKRLTLAQIYDWMVKNVAYFKDKGDSNSSAGWKNSIRHNLSLHSKFKRIQNEGTGKSSWWTINYDAKPGKSPRRRATSMDPANNGRFKKSKAVAKQKAQAELLKKQAIAGKSGSELSTWIQSPTGSVRDELDKPCDYRARTSSNASSIGHMSPIRTSSTHYQLPTDLEDDGAPPLSPLASSFSSSANFPEFFNLGRADSYSLLESLDCANTHDEFNTELLGSIEGMEIPSDNCCPTAQQTDIYLTCTTMQQHNTHVNNYHSATFPTQQQHRMGLTSTSSAHHQQTQGADEQLSSPSANQAIGSSPNLAKLLKQNSSKPKMIGSSNENAMRSRSNTMPRLQPQPKYSMLTSPPAPPTQQQQNQATDQSKLLGSSLPKSSQEQQQRQKFSHTPPPPASSPSPISSSYDSHQSQLTYMTLQQKQQQPIIIWQPDCGNSQPGQNKSLYDLLGVTETTAEQPSKNNSFHQPSSHHSPSKLNNPSLLQAYQHGTDDGRNLGTTLHSSNTNFYQGLQQLDRREVTGHQNISSSNLMQMCEENFPSDIDLDNQDIFDSGTLDVDQMLHELEDPALVGLDLYNYLPQTSTDTGFSPSMDVDGSVMTSPEGDGDAHNSFAIPRSNIQQQQQQMLSFSQQQQHNLLMTSRMTPETGGFGAGQQFMFGDSVAGQGQATASQLANRNSGQCYPTQHHIHQRNQPPTTITSYKM